MLCCRGVREGNVDMPKEVRKDLQEFQTALRLPGTEEQQKTQTAAGSKSNAASSPKDFKVSSTPAAQAQQAGGKSSAASPSKDTKVTATSAAQGQQAGSKSSPTAAASMPSSSQPSATKTPQVHHLLSCSRLYICSSSFLPQTFHHWSTNITTYLHSSCAASLLSVLPGGRRSPSNPKLDLQGFKF